MPDEIGRYWGSSGRLSWRDYATPPPPLIPPGYYPKGTPAPSDSPGVLSQDATGTTERSKVVDSLPLLGPRSQSTRQWKAPKQASRFLCRASNFLCRASKKKASNNLGGCPIFGVPPGAPDPIKLPPTPASPTRESKNCNKNENKTWSNFVPPTKMTRRLRPKPPFFGLKNWLTFWLTFWLPPTWCVVLPFCPSLPTPFKQPVAEDH